MKILHIAPTPFFADRGCHMRILGEIKALSNLNYEIVLTTYHIGRDIEDIKTKRIVKIPWYSKLEAGSSWHKFYLDILLIWTSIRTCLKEKPDIIHGHLHEGVLIGWIVSFVASLRKIPVVFDVQGSLSGELETYGFFKGIKILKNLFVFIEKIICRLPDYFICSSDSNARLIKEVMNINEDKILLIPDGMDPDFFLNDSSEQLKKQIGISPSKKIVIYSGSLINSKGIDYFLDAIPDIIARFSNVFFLIIGYPVAYCINKAKVLKIEDNLHFTGKVDFFQLPQYLALADIGVDPKVDEGGEGSGKIINYMGAALPVVCFDTLNNRMMLKENGFFAKLCDSKDFANKVVEALANDSLAREMGKFNQENAKKNFSWASSGNKLSNIYSKLTSL